MKLPFEDLGQVDSSKKLSLTEKSIIKAGVLLIKAALWKLNRAKTYGDLESLGKFIESKSDTFMSQVEKRIETNQSFDHLAEDIEDLADEIKNNVKR